MKTLINFWRFLRGKRQRPQLRESLVDNWQEDEALRSALRANLHSAGTQALLQVIEMEAAAETEACLKSVSERHAGAAVVLYSILEEVRNTLQKPKEEKE